MKFSYCLTKIVMIATVSVFHVGLLRANSEGPVSLVAVIALPEKFDGRDISVTGIASIGFERNALFLSIVDFDYYVSENAIKLELSDEQFSKVRNLDGKVCRVFGKFYVNREIPNYCGRIVVDLISGRSTAEEIRQ